MRNDINVSAGGAINAFERKCYIFYPIILIGVCGKIGGEMSNNPTSVWMNDGYKA